MLTVFVDQLESLDTLESKHPRITVDKFGEVPKGPSLGATELDRISMLFIANLEIP